MCFCSVGARMHANECKCMQNGKVWFFYFLEDLGQYSWEGVKYSDSFLMWTPVPQTETICFVFPYMRSKISILQPRWGMKFGCRNITKKGWAPDRIWILTPHTSWSLSYSTASVMQWANTLEKWYFMPSLHGNEHLLKVQWNRKFIPKLFCSGGKEERRST